MIPSIPSDAIRQLALFEQLYWRLCEELPSGQVPPSREVILETARRHPRLSACEVVLYWRAHWAPPPIFP